MGTRANSSMLWEYFTKNNVTKKAQCSLCSESYSYKSTTGNLKVHLRKKHFEVYKLVEAGQMSEQGAADVSDSNEEFETLEVQEVCQEPEKSASPMFIEFIEHSDNSSSPKKEKLSATLDAQKNKLLGKRKRRVFDRQYADDSHTSTQRHILEIKRLELETLREKNLYEKERIRAQLDRDAIKVNERLVAFLEDIKPSLLKFLDK